MLGIALFYILEWNVFCTRILKHVEKKFDIAAGIRIKIHHVSAKGIFSSFLTVRERTYWSVFVLYIRFNTSSSYNCVRAHEY